MRVVPPKQGRLQLASTDPRAQPLIQLNFTADPQDLRRLVAGVHLSRGQDPRQPAGGAH